MTQKPFSANFLYLVENKYEILLSLIALTLPFDILYNNISIILLGVVTLLDTNFWKNLNETFKQRKLLFIGLSLLYLFHIIGLLWSNDVQKGLFDLEKKFSILLFAFIILLNGSIKAKHAETVLKTFVGACLFEATFCLTKAFYFSLTVDVMKWENFSREGMLRPVQSWLHPTDFAMYLVFAFGLIVQHIKDKWKSATLFYIVLNILLAIYLLFFVISMASRTPLIALTILLLYNFVSYLYASRNKAVAFSIVTLCMLCLTLAFLSLNSVKDRFVELFNDSYALPYGTHHNSTNIRMATFLCSYEIFLENPIIGVGTGDAQPALDQCYYRHDFSTILYRDSYNSHNQYLQTSVGLGSIGLIILVINFLVATYRAFLRKSNVHLLFVFLFCICCLTESMLCYQKGVVFFSFFFSLLETYPLLEGKKELY